MSNNTLPAVGHIISQNLGPIRPVCRFFTHKNDGVVLKLSRYPGVKTARRPSRCVRVLNEKNFFYWFFAISVDTLSHYAEVPPEYKGARLGATFMIA